jgi:hypothetical protein
MRRPCLPYPSCLGNGDPDLFRLRERVEMRPRPAGLKEHQYETNHGDMSPAYARFPGTVLILLPEDFRAVREGV